MRLLSLLLLAAVALADVGAPAAAAKKPDAKAAPAPAGPAAKVDAKKADPTGAPLAKEATGAPATGSGTELVGQSLRESKELEDLTQAMFARIQEEQGRIQSDIRLMTRKAIDDIRATVKSVSLSVDKAAAKPAGKADAKSPAAKNAKAIAGAAKKDGKAVAAAGAKPAAAQKSAAAAGGTAAMFIELAEGMFGSRADAGVDTLHQLNEELARSLEELTSELGGADGEMEHAERGADAEAATADAASEAFPQEHSFAEAGVDADEDAAPAKAAPGAKGGAPAAAGAKGGALAAAGKADAKKPAAAAAAAAKAPAKGEKAGLRGSAPAAAAAGASDGLIIRPAPDQPEGPITLRRRDAIGGAPAFVRAVAGQHSWDESLPSLLSEVDESEAKAKALRLRIVEKENFLESLDKRRSLIQADIDADKSTFSLLRAHTRAVSARVARLKKERLSQEIKAQQQQYAAAAKKLSGEVASIQQVVAALDSRVRNIDSEVAPLAKAEFDGMQESLQASAAAPAAAKPAASAAKPAAAAAAKPAAKAAEKN